MVYVILKNTFYSDFEMKTAPFKASWIMFIETIKYNVQQNSLRLKETLYSSRKMFDWLPLRLLAKYGELMRSDISWAEQESRITVGMNEIRIFIFSCCKISSSWLESFAHMYKIVHIHEKYMKYIWKQIARTHGMRIKICPNSLS